MLGDRKDIKTLTSLLRTRINQQKMLNDTLCEVLSKDAASKTVNLIRDEINELTDEITEINKDIAKCNQEAIYEHYDSAYDNKSAFDKIAEDEKGKSSGFYDSIVKQTKAAEFKEAEDAKKGVKYDYSSVYDKIREYSDTANTVVNDDLTKKYVDDLRNTADARMLGNRFLVDLKESLGIPEVMVKGVAFDLENNRVSVWIYDFITEDEGLPIMEVLKYSTSLFDFNIKHLNAVGEVLYTEFYEKCMINTVYRDPLDYTNSEFSTIQVLINYNDVEYETADKERQ